MPTVPPERTPFGGRESHQAREIAESFGSDPDRYDRARPRYPGALIDRIAARTRRPQPPSRHTTWMPPSCCCVSIHK
jgi:hypothetical protein